VRAAPARRSARSWLAWSFAMSAVGCAADDGGPHIASVAPPAGRAGDAITLRGRAFCGGAAASAECWRDTAGAVTFGINPPMVRASVVSWDDDTIVVTVPESVAPGGTELVVIVDGLSSNAADFEVL
jgi:hypothetical protein